MDEFAQKLFLDAKHQYESATRWLFGGVLLLVFLHLMVFDPYVDLTRRHVEVENTIQEQQELSLEITNMQKQLDALRQRLAESAWRVLDIEKLSVSFRRLDSVIFNLRAIGPEAARGADGAAAFTRANNPVNTLQQGPEPAGFDLPIMEPDIRAAISVLNEANILDLLDEYINDKMMVSVFDTMTEEWRRESVSSDAHRVIELTEEAAIRHPEFKKVFEEIKRILLEFEAFSKTLAFSPPQDRRWWRTTGGKDEEFRALFRGIDEELVNLKLPPEAHLLDDKIAAAMSESEKIKHEIARLESQFQEQLSALSGYVEPLKGFVLHLSTLSQRFPVILGLLLSACISWRAYRLRRLSLVVSSIGGGQTALVAAAWTASLTATRRVTIAKAIFLFVVFGGWILLGAASAAGLPDVEARATFGSAVVSVALIALAVGFQYVAEVEALESRGN